jgi:hypothetical protein
MSLKAFFCPNIGPKGRIFRGVFAVALLAAAAFTFSVSFWLGLALLLAGLVGAFEALRGWCLLRACRMRLPF